MEETETIDSFDYHPEKIGVQAIRLFISSLILSVLAFSIILLEKVIRINETFIGLSVLFLILSFALSIGGLNVGLTERKYRRNIVNVSIIGNIILIALPPIYLGISIYILITASRLVF